MERNVAIDLIKTLACIMVITLHVSAEFFYTFSSQWNIVNMFDSCMRACVPLFFMCSGTLLLKKDEPIGAFYKKRLLRIVPPLFFWAFCYLFWYGYLEGDLSFPGVLRQILYGTTIKNFHLWFLYAVLGLYLVCPFLRKIYAASTDKEMACLVGLWFLIASGMPLLETLSGIPNFLNSFNTFYFTGFIGYFALGICLLERVETSGMRRAGALAVYLISNALIYFFTYKLSFVQGKPTELFYSYLSPVVIVNAVALFFLLIHVRVKNSFLARMISMTAQYSYGIYCVHIFVLRSLHLSADMDMRIYIPVKSILVFVLSFAIIHTYLFVVRTKCNNNRFLRMIV